MFYVPLKLQRAIQPANPSPIIPILYLTHTLHLPSLPICIHSAIHHSTKWHAHIAGTNNRQEYDGAGIMLHMQWQFHLFNNKR